MTDRLQEIRARLDSMSWVSDEFIAHAPADIAWLLDEVERLRAPVHRMDLRTGVCSCGFVRPVEADDA